MPYIKKNKYNIEFIFKYFIFTTFIEMYQETIFSVASPLAWS